jgi:hypothetical protein
MPIPGVRVPRLETSRAGTPVPPGTSYACFLPSTTMSTFRLTNLRILEIGALDHDALCY